MNKNKNEMVETMNRVLKIEHITRMQRRVPAEPVTEADMENFIKQLQEMASEDDM